MNEIKKILVPVDLSESCKPAIEFATRLAKCHGAELQFCYVALPMLPIEANFYQGDIESQIVKEHGQFHQITPSDLTIKYNHVFVRGNPGPEIVRLAKSKNCDLIVMATHGRTGLLRFVMGSVAEYVMRHSQTPVVTVKSPNNVNEGEAMGPAPETNEVAKPIQSPYITSAMSHSLPIHEFDEMPEVIEELKSAHCSAAPVIDGLGKCIGILTNSDIEKYHELAKRFEARDMSVLDEVFDTGKYGMRILDRNAFHRVKKHMTSPVVTIFNNATCHEAKELLAANPKIHHLVVLDENNSPIGIVEYERLTSITEWNLQDEISV